MTTSTARPTANKFNIQDIKEVDENSEEEPNLEF